MLIAEQALAEAGHAQDGSRGAGGRGAEAAARAAAQWPPQFWDDAKRYADRSSDKQFARELAYLLVTLHRHGA